MPVLSWALNSGKRGWSRAYGNLTVKNPREVKVRARILSCQCANAEFIHLALATSASQLDRLSDQAQHIPILRTNTCSEVTDLSTFLTYISLSTRGSLHSEEICCEYAYERRKYLLHVTLFWIFKVRGDHMDEHCNWYFSRSNSYLLARDF